MLSRVYIHAVRADGPEHELAAAIRDMMLQASDNLAWLSPGETVLLKPALNSGDPYPSTTHPLAVHAVADLLAE
ncbi:DUF362 domain-containing protein, partial [Methanoculleus sp. FWC-SCC1]|nr:DUF362 domain-containing protein [Methanoculleus sp. FWC-SCC1]